MSAVTGDVIPPYESVCRVNTLRSYAGLFERTFTGSTAVLDNGFLLTAAHNFHRPFYPSSVVRYNVQCGVGVNAEHRHYSHAVDSKGGVIYQHPNDFRYHRYHVDFALVATCQSTGSSFRLPNDAVEVKSLLEKSLITAGYPAEGNNQIQGIELDGSQMFHVQFKVKDPDARVETIRYALPNGGCINTFRGQSGSPLWVEADSGEYVVIGVHVAEAKAVIFNQEKIDWLKEQMAQLSNQCSTFNRTSSLSSQ